MIKSLLLLLVTLCCMISGCGQMRSPENFFNKLLDRISNVTEVPTHSMGILTSPPSYPRPRDMLLPVEDIRVGFSTYIGLGRCGLVGEVSARNSSLGKLQSPTARLLYERRFLRQLKGCIQDLRQSNEKESKKFLDDVEIIAERKTALLPTVFWNATFGSPEFRLFLTTHKDPLPLQSDVSSTELVTALQFISSQGVELQRDQDSPNQSGLESQYYLLQSSRLVGQLIRSMLLTTEYMLRGSELLESAQEQRKICPMGRKTVKGEYLFNVFQKFYIGQAQPYLSLIHTRARPLVDVIQELVKEQKVEFPAGFKVFYDQTLNPETEFSIWNEFNSAMSRHTMAWQSVLKQCDLMPRVRDSEAGGKKVDGLI